MVIVIKPWVVGLYEQVAVNELSAETLLPRQPGTFLPFTLKVIFPAMLEIAVINFAWR